jgi:DNA ligase (NAD+)
VNRVKELEQLIKDHKAFYYAGSPKISDLEYDKLEDELRELDPQNSILDLVGSETNSKDKVKHDKKMLSLGKTYKEDELSKWIGENDVIAVYKIDGVSCSLIYEDGHLVLAKTRGDGQFGEDITSKARWMKGVPKSISIKDRIEVRGEIYCDEESFFHLSDEMVEKGLEKPSSQRNIVAGLVGRKENLELCRYIDFKAFDILGLDDLKKETEKYDILKRNDFSILDISHPKTAKDLTEIIENAKTFMSEGEFLIDGIVFIYNELSLHDELGETAHHPRYKMAFKFQGEVKTTTLNDITWQVSRNGFLTPVGEVEPIDISGAKISRVTLHNYGMVRQYNLKKGDKIEIIRSGEVIPKFMSVIEESNNEFIIPSTCPSCEKTVVVDDIRLVCRNDACPAQVKEGILNYIQKIGIDDLSSKRLDEMILKGLVTKIEDLYELDKEKLMTLDKVKDKLASKLIDGIEKSKQVDLITFLSALGISGGAYNKCEKVVTGGFDTIEKIKSMKIDDLIMLEGFAEKSATEFVRSIKSKKELIDHLISKGFSFKSEINKVDGPLIGHKICITGSLSDKRSNVEAKIRDLGGQVVGSVSKNTTMLLTNETEAKSSKFKKALELGIEVINEDKLNSMVGA